MSYASIDYLNIQFDNIFSNKITLSKTPWSRYSRFFLSQLYNFIFYCNKTYITIGYDNYNDVNYSMFDMTLHNKDVSLMIKEMIKMINYEFYDLLHLSSKEYRGKNVIYIHFKTII